MMKNGGTASAVTVDRLRVVRGGRTVLPGLSVEVPSGEVVGLLGPSGCGKSTVLRAVVGVQRIAEGSVEVLGLPAGHRRLRHRVAYMTQASSVYPDLTVGQNLRYFASVLGASAADVDRTLDEVDLRSKERYRVAALSGGERSRTSLAAALLGRPQLLVLDEPTVGLDPVLRRDLWDLFGRLAASGVTLLVSSHVMDEAVRCDRLLLMREGGLLFDGTVPALLESTGAGDVEQAFLRIVEDPARFSGGGTAKASGARSETVR